MHAEFVAENREGSGDVAPGCLWQPNWPAAMQPAYALRANDRREYNLLSVENRLLYYS